MYWRKRNLPFHQYDPRARNREHLGTSGEGRPRSHPYLAGMTVTLRRHRNFPGQ